jgi:hypothetical protein
MIRERIEKLEHAIRESATLSDQAKAEVLGRLAEMKAEAAHVPAVEGTLLPVPSPANDQGPIVPILNELSASIDGLEASHPRLTQLTNQLAMTLANMGI